MNNDTQINWTIQKKKWINSQKHISTQTDKEEIEGGITGTLFSLGIINFLLLFPYAPYSPNLIPLFPHVVI